MATQYTKGDKVQDIYTDEIFTVKDAYFQDYAGQRDQTVTFEPTHNQETPWNKGSNLRLIARHDAMTSATDFQNIDKPRAVDAAAVEMRRYSDQGYWLVAWSNRYSKAVYLKGDRSSLENAFSTTYDLTHAFDIDSPEAHALIEGEMLKPWNVERANKLTI